MELWVSGMGAECSQYEENKWCTTDGGYGPGSTPFLTHTAVFLWHAADFQPAIVFDLIIREQATPEQTENITPLDPCRVAFPHLLHLRRVGPGMGRFLRLP